MDAMATDESPSSISDKIKEILFNKSAERIDAFKTDVANGVFGDVDLEDEDLEDEECDVDLEDEDLEDDETVDEVEDEVEAEDETEVEAELEDQQ